MFMKNPEAVVGPGDTTCSGVHRALAFMHEAELALVINDPAKMSAEGLEQRGVATP